MLIHSVQSRQIIVFVTEVEADTNTRYIEMKRGNERRQLRL